jgi:diketogulonate reductase-like aldo/keto reductase
VYPNRDSGGYVREAFNRSCKKLGVKKLGLYLLHFPFPDTYIDCWKEFEKLYKEGLVDAIGVCNCEVHHLQTIMETCEIVPFVDQVECHPYLAQDDLLAFGKEHGIQIEAYSPFARNLPDLIYNPILKGIAKTKGKNVHQVILRWDFQRDVIAIPKASSMQRIEQNCDIFDFTLSDEEMSRIQSLNKGFRIRFNPDTVDYADL